MHLTCLLKKNGQQRAFKIDLVNEVFETNGKMATVLCLATNCFKLGASYTVFADSN